ncbi:DUF6086 family protein [Aliiroseovarius marinus]|uniref:DUF6086 family protein n=1 Tax=Aliiroseovarius marinus TaxID=2500159 RepID=UPI00105D38AF|nr:DUF6086 family protein [Aliiroseovarius marinus]
MSIFFIDGEKTVWNPGNSTARLYLDMTRSLESFLGVPSGLSKIIADEVHIDAGLMRVFVSKYERQDHQIVLTLAEGHYLVTCVLCSRMDIPVSLDSRRIKEHSAKMPI